MTGDRYGTLLTPMVTALDRLIAASPRGAQLDAARDFLEFKLYAAIHVGNQIREQLSERMSEVTSGPDELEARVDHAARFALYVLVDGFLFETGSIRDALLQLVNVAFDLGIRDDDKALVIKVRERMNVTSQSETGLESWIEAARSPSWLWWLTQLRNAATHRRVLRLPEQYQWTHGADGPPSWQARTQIEAHGGGYERLDDFLERTEREMSGLLVVSLERLKDRMNQPR
jgi:hypothetical protein